MILFIFLPLRATLTLRVQIPRIRVTWFSRVFYDRGRPPHKPTIPSFLEAPCVKYPMKQKNKEIGACPAYLRPVIRPASGRASSTMPKNARHSLHNMTWLRLSMNFIAIPFHPRPTTTSGWILLASPSPKGEVQGEPSKRGDCQLPSSIPQLLHCRGSGAALGVHLWSSLIGKA